MKNFKLILLAICFAFPIILMGCENENISVLSTPNNLTVENGMISFDMVEDADYYSISINNMVFSVDAKHNSNVSIIDGVIKYDANKIFNNNNSYIIKIKARASDKHDSHYSNVVDYIHTIELTIPTNVSISGKMLTWSGVEDATKYVVKVFNKTYNETITYDCNVNYCDITASLAQCGAGEYEYSVKAVRVGKNATETEFSLPVNYIYKQKLSIPTIENVYIQEEAIYLQAKIDENANKITIICGEDVRNIMLNGTSQSVVQDGENLTINLTEIFGESKFDALTKYLFKVVAKYETLGVNYYENSEESNGFVLNKTQKLSSPIIELNYDENFDCYVLTWNKINESAGYKILIRNGTTVEYFTTKDVTTFLINEDFESIKIIAIGVGNYLDSDYSNIVTK